MRAALVQGPDVGVPQELLVGMPLPRIALRPSRDQGGRRAVRSGAQYGPAPRSMDRFAIRVESDGTVVADTSGLEPSKERAERGDDHQPEWRSGELVVALMED